MSDDNNGNPYRKPGAKYPKAGPVVVVDNSKKEPPREAIVARMADDFRTWGRDDRDIYAHRNRRRSEWMDR
jgi:hypothetical protein